MSNMFKTIAAVAAVSLVSGFSAASAATISADESLNLSHPLFTQANDVLNGTELVYTFTADTDLRVLEVLSAVGTSATGGADVTNATLGLNGDLAQFQDLFVSEGSGIGISRFSGFNLAAGESFTFTFNNEGGADLIGTSLSFSIAAVPVPAAGLLLIGALGGLGAAARRKKKAAV